MHGTADLTLMSAFRGLRMVAPRISRSRKSSRRSSTRRCRRSSSSGRENEDLDASRGVMGVMDKRKAWQNKLNEGRWAAILWPEEWGGRAATTAQQVIYTQVMAKYRVARHLQRQRHRADRAVDHLVGHRRPEGALAARHPRRERALVPGLLRTAGRLRPREPAHDRDPLRRRVALRRERPEDLDQLRADREVGPVPDAHRPDRDRARPQARGHHHVHRRHGAARHRHPPDPRDHRRLAVLRGVLRPT